MRGSLNDPQGSNMRHAYEGIQHGVETQILLIMQVRNKIKKYQCAGRKQKIFRKKYKQYEYKLTIDWNQIS